MFVSKEEHEGNGIVEFVHLLEVGDLIEVADVDNGEVLDTIGDAWGKLAAALGRNASRHAMGEDCRNGRHDKLCSVQGKKQGKERG